MSLIALHIKTITLLIKVAAAITKRQANMLLQIPNMARELLPVRLLIGNKMTVEDIIPMTDLHMEHRTMPEDQLTTSMQEVETKATTMVTKLILQQDQTEAILDSTTKEEADSLHPIKLATPTPMLLKAIHHKDTTEAHTMTHKSR